MRLFWIIVGIVALIWLGFLHFDRNEIRLDLDKTNERIDNVEHNVNGNNEPVAPQDELNVGEEVQDEMDDAREEVEQGIPTKEEQAKDEAQDEQEEAKEEEVEKSKQNEKVKEEKQPKDVETSLPPTEPTSFVEEEAIVAFNLGYTEDVSHAFKQFDTPKFEDEIASSEAYLDLDPMILSLK